MNGFLVEFKILSSGLSEADNLTIFVWIKFGQRLEYLNNFLRIVVQDPINMPVRET